MLKALGFQTCNDLIAKRGLISALFKPLSVDFFIKAGLGFGQTGHSALPEPGAVGRRGMSVERTFPAVSKPADLEAWVRSLLTSMHMLQPHVIQLVNIIQLRNPWSAPSHFIL